MAHKQATDPTALEVLFGGEGHFRAARCSLGGTGEIARPADDNLILVRIDGHQQRDRPLEIRPRDSTEFGVADIGSITKEPRVNRVLLKFVKGTTDLRSVTGARRADRHRGSVPERLGEDIASKVLHASSSRSEDGIYGRSRD